MSEEKRILIMTCSHGSGHQMIAQTLKDKYEEYGCEVKVFDIFNEYNRLLNITMEKLYLLSYKGLFENIYGFLYNSFNSFNHKQYKHFDHLFYGLFKDIVINVINGYDPDLIVNTYNHRTVAINKKEFYPDIPLVNVVTEFTLPSFWVHDNVDKYYLACEETKNELLDYGEKDEKIEVFGIPVRKNFLEELDLESLYKKYNIDKNKTTVILFAGTFGVLKHITQICNRLEKMNDIQTIVICGLNKKLYKKLKRKNYENIRLMRYISEIQELYAVGDIMITKPGGTVLSEIVKTKIPVILYNPVPGQEMENAKIFDSLNAGIVANKVDDLISEVLFLSKNKEKRKTMSSNLEKMDYGDSAKLIVEDSLKLI